MKNLVVVVALFFFTNAISQSKKIADLQFFSWVSASDQIVYDVALVYFLPAEETSSNQHLYDGIVRVKYKAKGVEKLVEYKAKVLFSFLKNLAVDNKQTTIFTKIIEGYPTAKIIKGSGSYITDNFVMTGVINAVGSQIHTAYQIDDNQIFYTRVTSPLIFDKNVTIDDELVKIKTFFFPSDEIYPILIDYLENYYEGY